MFGAMLANQWAIVYTTKKSDYFLSEDHDEDFANIVWTHRKDKARRFASKDEVLKAIEAIRTIRQNKKTQQFLKL